MAKCSICKKSAVSGFNVSHSQVHTKRKFKANLQKVNGVILCTRCIKTLKKSDKLKMEESAPKNNLKRDIAETEQETTKKTSANNNI